MSLAEGVYWGFSIPQIPGGIALAAVSYVNNFYVGVGLGIALTVISLISLVFMTLDRK